MSVWVTISRREVFHVLSFGLRFECDRDISKRRQYGMPVWTNSSSPSDTVVCFRSLLCYAMCPSWLNLGIKSGCSESVERNDHEPPRYSPVLVSFGKSVVLSKVRASTPSKLYFCGVASIRRAQQCRTLHKSSPPNKNRNGQQHGQMSTEDGHGVRWTGAVFHLPPRQSPSASTSVRGLTHVHDTRFGGAICGKPGGVVGQGSEWKMPHEIMIMDMDHSISSTASLSFNISCCCCCCCQAPPFYTIALKEKLCSATHHQ
ncbi:hypothetical protein B0T20DRAFT_397741 [Sordaria brevicollis]|uniref:Uncharacterized protein n=1 Tax=Sordaria brevicollis TaxID=83679 RepID=A0AAE0NWA0_SORBR|nr:hypothetical protein B0T20DRAFT_397741 [Sordaria brevicollis]